MRHLQGRELRTNTPVGRSRADKRSQLESDELVGLDVIGNKVSCRKIGKTTESLITIKFIE
jgi:hypothetical protein